MVTKIKNRFAQEKTPGIDFDPKKKESKSKTQQQFAKDADINTIWKRYQKTGLLVDPLTLKTRRPQFGDFSQLGDYQTVKNLVIDIEKRFMTLPSQLRARFENDPSVLLEWLADPANRKEAGELGLMEKLPPTDKDGNPIPQPAPQTPETPAEEPVA